jgi:multidrug resistance efflux pump
VQYEPDGTSSGNVTREAQALSRAQGGNTVLSITLRRQSEIEGVLTLEFAPGQQLGPQAATGLSVAADLLAPQLYDRFQNDRWLITKTGISIRENTKLLIGPKHMLAKLITATVLAAILFITFFKPIYHVSAPFALAADERRYICAPFEGYIYKVNVHPGDTVKKGDILFELNTYQLKDQLAEATARRNAAENERKKNVGDRRAITSGIEPAKIADAKIAEAQRDAAQAEMSVIQGKIDRAIVKAEIDGQVLDMGELRYKIGAPVKLGDQLMVVGQPANLYAELRVAERDIQDVRASLQKGDLAVSSAPTEKVPFKIDRIVPTTEVKENETIYKVKVRVDESSPNWKPEMKERLDKWLPGMEGQARVDVGNRRLAWIWTHRFVDWTRLHLWSNPLFAPFFK